MQIRVEDCNGVSVFSLEGEPGREGELPREVARLNESQVGKIVIDLSHVQLINSSFLGDLVRLTAQANTQGGRLVLAGPTPFVEGVLKTTRLNRFFEVRSDVPTAIQAMA